MNKVDMITGGASGIGKAIALKLAHNNYDIALVDINEININKAVKEIKDLNVDCLGLQGDVSNKEAMSKVFKELYNHYGRLDVLVNNAGICPIRKIDHVSSSQMINTFNINVISMVICSKEAIKIMEKQGEGVILNAASQSSFRETPVTFEYTTTKWAIRGMTQAMAQSLKPLNIRVNAFCPGTVITDMQDKIAKQTAKEMHLPAFVVRKVQLKSQALGRFQTLDDIASLAYFLVSDKSEHINGQNILCNGGQVMN